MSFWTRLGLKISDLECFKESCRRHGIEYVENQDKNFKIRGFNVHAILNDQTAGAQRQGFLVRDGGAFKMVVDNDASYSTISKRLGRNGGKLTRDYAHNVVKKGVARSGAMINSCKERADGSLVLRVVRV